MKKRSATISEIVSIMFKHSSKIRIQIIIELFFLIADGFFISRVPALLKFVIDGLEKGYDNFLLNHLNETIFYSVGISVGWFVSAMIQHYLKEKNSTTIMVSVQLSLYEHLQNLSMEFYQSTYIGEITSRLTNDIYKSIKEIYQAFTHIIWLAGLVIPSLITMASYDVGFFGIYVALLFIFTCILMVVLPIVRKKQRLAMDQMGSINAKLTESIYSMVLIKSFSQEKNVADKIQKECVSFLDKILKTTRIRVIGTDTSSMLIGVLAPTSLLWIGALLRIEISILIAFYSYWLTTGARIRGVLDLLQKVTEAFASFDRVFDFFQHTAIVQDLPDAEKALISNGKIEIKNMTFGYLGAKTNKGFNVFNDFSLTIPARSRVAIVGRSGCGKSTLFSLLMRFFDPDSGQVIIDGKNIRTVDQKFLRSQIGIVMQETLLLNGTIRENMQFVSPDTDDREIIQALEYAKIWSYFESQGNGLDTMIGERGARLSGGQRQRISIARIFLKKPAIVLLDEATASMDSETEKAIVESMEKILSGRTSIIISHRLSTVQDCDEIIVLDQGKIVDKGQHAKLYHRCELYHNLCMRQDLTGA